MRTPLQSSLLSIGGILATTVALWSTSCSGGGSSYSAPSAPGAPNPSPTSSASVTVTIVGISGNRSFQPNPVMLNAGDTIAIRNADGATHHIVLDDGSLDLGVVAAGMTSAPMKISGSGGNFHCTIHPSMVGNINGTTPSNPPPCMNPGYC